MSRAPLLILAAALAAAPAAAQTQRDPSQAYLRDQGFDVEQLSPAALKAAQGDPQGFARRNRAAYQRFQEWSTDPERMFAADRRSPGTAEATLRQLSGVLAPEQLAPLEAQWKLAPHGVKADVPQSASFDAGSQRGARNAVAAEDGGDDRAAAPPAGPAPASGLRIDPVAPPSAPAAPQADNSLLDNFFNWACAKFGCAKT